MVDWELEAIGLELGGFVKTMTQADNNAEETHQPLRLCGEIFPAALWTLVQVRITGLNVQTR